MLERELDRFTEDLKVYSEAKTSCNSKLGIFTQLNNEMKMFNEQPEQMKNHREPLGFQSQIQDLNHI